VWFHGAVGSNDDEDPGLPLKLWPCSNGEYLPAPLDDLRREAMRRARVAADVHARRHRWSRRRFLLSSAGMASGLSVLQACSDERSDVAGTEPGGVFRVPASAATDPEEATTTIHGPSPSSPATGAPVSPADLVVDVQTHFLESGDWGTGFPQGGCGAAERIDCFSAEHWYDLVFRGSDTAVAVISAVPVVGAADPLSIDAMARGRDLAAELCADDRVLIQGHAVPDVGPLDAALASMAEVAAAHRLSAWKVYTHAPGGWFLDDHDPAVPAIGAPFLRAVRDTGVPVVAVHKGLSGGNRFASPVDVGPAAAAHPDLRFLVYHAGYEADVTEGAHDPAGAGVDRLVRSVADAGIGPGGNVYAELGSTWRTVMGSPDQAAHVLGKLLVAFGPERILWGTDSIWYGSPQDQIAAFRAFEITPAFQERFGYPALTADVKRRILGANAVELFAITPPAGDCRDADEPPSAWRRPNRTFGPVSRRDIVTTFAREHPWTVTGR
jgi:predicted TIM-barrel fold metal-dependent hydrolase